MKRSTLLGSENDNPRGYGSYTEDIHDEQLGIAISVGGKAGCHSHKDLNEDSVGYAVSERFRYIVLADAYNGSDAAEKFVSELINGFQGLVDLMEEDPNPQIFRNYMIDTIYPVSERILQRNLQLPQEYHNRSQLSSVLLDTTDDTIYWANFGDSRIYATWKVDTSHLITPVDYRSLCYPMTKMEFLDGLYTGTFAAKEEHAIIVCSDGFPEAQIPEIKPHQLIKWINRYDTARDAVANMMEHAFANEACDNLSVGIIIS